MKVHTLKSILTSIVLACLTLTVNAQFDDVYYNPDHGVTSGYEDPSYDEYADNDGVTYYDDDEYEYYDDYNYYYSSRIRRFHSHYRGFDFYDPWYTSYNYYNPYDYNAYYYPGASIYISFGNADYWSYRNWRRWNQWNRYHHYHHWDPWYSPSSYYYSYNSWCAPSYSYWGGHHSYHSYSNYYNNYYNYCPTPLSNYYGVTNSTVHNVNTGSSRGSYYGPRIAGNTGSSPRGPIVKPENVQPVLSETGNGVNSEKNPFVKTREQQELNGGTNPTGNVRNLPTENPDNTPAAGSVVPAPRDQQTSPNAADKVKESDAPVSKRPVFRPYPSKVTSPSKPIEKAPADDRGYTPRSKDQSPDRTGTPPQYRPDPSDRPERPTYTPPSRNERNDERPSYTPREDRPSYSPPARSERSEEKPAYTPSRREEPRPSYTPPSRREDDRPSYSPPQRSEPSRSNDRPSYSPPSRNDSGSNHSAPRDNSSSRSGSGAASPRSRG